MKIIVHTKGMLLGEPIIEALDDGNVSFTVRRIRGTSWEVLVASRAQLLAASGIKPARYLSPARYRLRSSRDRFLFLTMQSTRAFWLIPSGSMEEKRPIAASLMIIVSGRT